MSAPRFVIIGNPGNRRVTMFQAELAQREMPPAIEISYRELLANPQALLALPDEPLLVRQDSAGEDAEVQRMLLSLGYVEAREQGVACASDEELARSPMRHGELRCPRQLHLGFLEALRRVEAYGKERPAARLLSPPQSVAELFDKRATSKRWRAMGIPTPECLDDVRSYDELRARVRERGWRSVYVKVSCSSSASGLALYHPGNPDWILTTIEHTREGWFNSLKLRRYSGRRAGEILQMILGEGAQVERAAPKAQLEGAHFDLRVVTIAGQPLFTVVRQSRHPITNLHLGGWRGSWEQLRGRLGADGLAAIDASCTRVAQASGCFCLGIDVLVEPDWKTHRIIEANAFGDLLPNLERGGKTVYGHQIESLAQRPWG